MRPPRPALAPALLLAAAAVAAGCEKAPDKLTFGDAALNKAVDDKLANGLKRVVYTPDGGAPADAKSSVTVTWAGKSDVKGGAPQVQVMLLNVVSSGMSFERWGAVTPTPTTACVVSRNLQSGRMTVHVQSCGDGNKGAVGCAAYEEVVRPPCAINDPPCRAPKSKALCAERLDKLAPELDAVRARVAR